jgi:hypothetical protein
MFDPIGSAAREGLCLKFAGHLPGKPMGPKEMDEP